MLAHYLVAHGIGGRTVAELSENMDVDEFLRWGIYRAIEPFGDDRADWRNAMVLQQQANMNRSKNSSPTRVGEFLLKFEHQPRKKSIEELKAVMDAQLVAGGGRLKK